MHHQLCFGCGRTNLFGLLLEAERAEDGSLAGRWFVKQDHQGPVRGRAHPGLVGCALLEAAMLAAGEGLEPRQVELELEPEAAPAVGSFCEVSASAFTDEGRVLAHASASAEGRPVGRLSATFAA